MQFILECAILLSACSLVAIVNVLYKWKKVMEFIKRSPKLLFVGFKQLFDPSNSFSTKVIMIYTKNS